MGVKTNFARFPETPYAKEVSVFFFFFFFFFFFSWTWYMILTTGFDALAADKYDRTFCEIRFSDYSILYHLVQHFFDRVYNPYLS